LRGIPGRAYLFTPTVDRPIEPETSKIALGRGSPGTAAHAPARSMVGLVQINNSLSGHDYLPYSVRPLQDLCAEGWQPKPAAMRFLAAALQGGVRIADAVEA